jgi:Tetratricopeptide repeat
MRGSSHGPISLSDETERISRPGHDQTVLLAENLRLLGKMQAARDLAQDTLDRRRRVLGQDHPGTLQSANHLAMILGGLGEVQAAGDLAQDTLDRRRRILGEDHPATLTSADNLAADLRALGEAGNDS